MAIFVIREDRRVSRDPGKTSEFCIKREIEKQNEKGIKKREETRRSAH